MDTVNIYNLNNLVAKPNAPINDVCKAESMYWSLLLPILLHWIEIVGEGSSKTDSSKNVILLCPSQY